MSRPPRHPALPYAWVLLALTLCLPLASGGETEPLPAVVQQHPILFVVRPQYKADHHNTATLFQTGEINTASFSGGSALKLIDFKAGGRVTTLLQLTEGMIRDLEVSFDGTEILFSMRHDQEDDYHIYKLRADGTGLTQLTFAAGISDIDPYYLPDGGLGFSSTREPKFCMCNRHIMANLFRMESNGANIRQIGKSTLFEGHGALLPDGRVLFDRWEYVDRNFGDAQGLWTVFPDGTNPALYWGNNTRSPGGVIDARPVPGTQEVVAVFTSCHDRPWGALALLDRRKGMDGVEPVLRTWPESARDLVGKGDYDTFKSVRPRYEDPYPLDETYFLCARTTGEGEEPGLYLVDRFGGERLLYEENPGCFDPMPLRSRARPPVIPSRCNLNQDEGHFYVVNVYTGAAMEGVLPGTIKALRVVESPEKQTWNTAERWNGQGQQNPGMNWHDFNNKRILGTVPVEEDGSASFLLPSERFVYFQLLDENGGMVQSMRSGTLVQPGEKTGCVGCHESRLSAPPVFGDGMPLALRRTPSRLQDWYGEERFFGYLAEVQPVFDRYCVECHDYGKEGGEKLNLARDLTQTFNTSYNELWRKGFIKAVGAGPAEVQKPYSWGSHASRLVQVVREGHGDLELKLDRESLDRIITWIDLNAPYYPFYASAYPDHLSGRSPMTREEVLRLKELTGVDFYPLADHRLNQGPMVSFDRPELSPCLARLADDSGPVHQEALTLIRAGSQRLARLPRADMPGFLPCPEDRERQQRYQARVEQERQNRRSAHEGQMSFDNR